MFGRKVNIFDVQLSRRLKKARSDIKITSVFRSIKRSHPYYGQLAILLTCAL